MKKHSLYSAILLATASMGSGLSAPVIAQEQTLVLEEVVVTARRREERLQDVPVSMTVLSQEQMHNANITNAGDIAMYTPSLSANNRFGADSTNFAIRGFSQELRTTSSVAVYFAEVVAPRGANVTQSGDGAGPGDFFDLENVQVLKGPQGTLFGRNTTGGAVLLTPKKPTDELGGYLEASAGNYDMKRAQGVLNVPVSDSFRMRFGVDHQKRDGYLNNITDVGPDDFADMDYTAVRASFVWDITDNLENYTIVKWMESSNNGSPYSLIGCNEGEAFGSFCQDDLDRRIASGNNDEYDVANFVPNSESEMEQIQAINTTTWLINDNLTLKNILSYAEFESRQNMALYGTDWRSPINRQGIMFQQVGARDFPTTDQKTWVEELQLQGLAFDERLTWQAGLYYEKSKPIDDYGSMNPSTLSCDQSTVESTNPSDWRCNDIIAAFGRADLGFGTTSDPTLLGIDPTQFTVGSGLQSPGGVTYTNKAVYAQGTWQFNDEWSMTAGLRYTDDETEGYVRDTVYYFPGNIFGGYFAPTAVSVDERKPTASSEEPTWTLGVEYKPSDDLMLYGKYSRGYRQGSVNLASVPSLAEHGPEQVDTYEIGAKTSFYGAVSGTFNISAFYNDFQDQQVQYGYLRDDGVGSTSIINAGTSTIWGVEIDGVLQLTENLSANYSYAYLNTNVDELTTPADPESIPGIARFSGTSTAEDEPLSYAPEHSVVLGLNYHLPVDEDLGRMVASVTYVYTDDQQAVSSETSPFYKLPSYELVNLNFNWQNVAGSPVDVTAFVTNLFDEEYMTNLTGNWMSGLEYGRVGTPRMYGARIRYNF